VNVNKIFNFVTEWLPPMWLTLAPMKRTLFILYFQALLILCVWEANSQEVNFDATTQIVGHNTNGLETPVNQLVTPAGTLIPLPGVRPNALALSPDGKLLVTSGLINELLVFDPATGKNTQQVPFPEQEGDKSVAALSSLILGGTDRSKLSFTGLAFSPDGTRIYLSNVNGDVKVFGVDDKGNVSGLFCIALPEVNMHGRKYDIPTGIAVSPDGKKIYVALNIGNQVAEFDAASGKLLRTWEVGVAPYDVVLCKNKLYVSNWGGLRPDASSVVGPIGQTGTVRVDENSVASEGSVSVIDLNDRSFSAEILTGRHACALALTPNQRYLAVANAAEDTISIIDTRTDKIAETLCARQNPADLFGAQPNALAFDKRGKKLYVCNGTQNAVAVFKFKPGGSQLLGLIPVGWFPGSVAFDSHRNILDVANIKDIAAAKQRAMRNRGNGSGFNTKQYTGSLSLVPVPSNGDLQKDTQIALADLRYPLLAQAKLPPRENQVAQPVPERVGEPSIFQHVIYIIKENRTYDQVLGDVAEGNGEADLCIFGQRVTPNEHKFVEDFTLLDNTYCCSILSADGHNWTDSGIATDYVEREFAGWPRSYPAGGGGLACSDALAYSPAGFIWNDAALHGKTVADFGEFTTAHHYWKSSGNETTNWATMYDDFESGSNDIVYTPEPDMASLKPYVVTNYVGFDLTVPDVTRAATFIQDLKQYEAAGNFPNLVILWLPDDHTSGVKFGEPKPEAQAADNDLAFGQVVDAMSHSQFWSNTCIFAIEDDPQDGWDHVNSYRTTAYVMSPYTKRHAVVSTQYNTTSLLRTLELILGLPPMNQMDATATPMFDCFTNVPDFTPYDAVTNNVPLNEMNPPFRSISDATLRQDAIVSAKLPLEKEDQCPEDVFNRILWRAAKGPKAPYPVQLIKPIGDDDD
jgi:DNA-binding beta-propeller fold protein YncE